MAKCRAIEVRDRVKHCTSDAVCKGLCAVHYVAAVRLIKRHNKLLELASKMEVR
jgi:hypothetical protein